MSNCAQLFRKAALLLSDLLARRCRYTPHDVIIVRHVVQARSQTPLPPAAPADSAPGDPSAARRELLRRKPDSVLGKPEENKRVQAAFRRACERQGSEMPGNKVCGVPVCFGELINRVMEMGGPERVQVSSALELWH